MERGQGLWRYCRQSYGSRLGWQMATRNRWQVSDQSRGCTHADQDDRLMGKANAQPQPPTLIRTNASQEVQLSSQFLEQETRPYCK